MLHLPCPDVILALTSPPMIGTLGMLHKQFHRSPPDKPVRFIYHVMDLFPDAVVASGIMPAGSLAERFFQRLTSRTLEVADDVIVLGRDMQERLVREYGHHVHRERMQVVPPWADGKLLFPMDNAHNLMARSLGLAETFNIVYSGNLGIAHDLETMTAAMELTRGEEQLRWVFIGGGKRFDALRRKVEQAGWRHVQLLGYQERENLNQSLNLADVHLVSQLPAFTGVVVPSKLFGIMAVGKPAVMIGPADAECSRIIREHEAGFVVPNGQPAELVDRLHQLHQDATLRHQIGARARQAFEAHYDRAIACDRIEAILCGTRSLEE